MSEQIELEEEERLVLSTQRSMEGAPRDRPIVLILEDNAFMFGQLCCNRWMTWNGHVVNPIAWNDIPKRWYDLMIQQTTPCPQPQNPA